MEAIKEELGKVAITVEKDYWDIKKAYDRLVIVELKGQFKTYISRIPVPAGISINNRDFWIPFSSLSEEASTKITAIYNKVNYLVDTIGMLNSIEDALLEFNRTNGVVIMQIYYKEGVKLNSITNNTSHNSKISVIYSDRKVIYNEEEYYKALVLLSDTANADINVLISWYPKTGYEYTDNDASDVTGTNVTLGTINYSTGNNPAIASMQLTFSTSAIPKLFIKNVKKT